MKKIITILVALLVAGWSFDANAQLTIGNKNTETTERIATLQQMWAWLYKTPTGFSYVSKTTNDFDDWMWLDLGPTKEEAAKTVDALIEALEVSADGDSLEIDNHGEKYVLVCDIVLGARSWSIRAIDTRRTYAGSGIIAMSALKKAQKELNK